MRIPSESKKSSQTKKKPKMSNLTQLAWTSKYSVHLFLLKQTMKINVTQLSLEKHACFSYKAKVRSWTDTDDINMV